MRDASVASASSRALDVHLLADVLLHPHAGATGTAAHATGAVARHLDDLDAGERAHDFAGRG